MRARLLLVRGAVLTACALSGDPAPERVLHVELPERVLMGAGQPFPDHWINGHGTLELGDRTVEALPTPGHHPSHLALWDSGTNVIFSGDTFYPGFLFVSNPDDWVQFADRMRRLLDFAEAKDATICLGGHVEMSTTPGVPYPYRTIEQPEETPLALSIDELREVVTAIGSLTEPGVVTFDRIVLFPACLEWPGEDEDRADVADGGDTDPHTDRSAHPAMDTSDPVAAHARREPCGRARRTALVI